MFFSLTDRSLGQQKSSLKQIKNEQTNSFILIVYENNPRKNIE
jgi:hypothetical protein